MKNSVWTKFFDQYNLLVQHPDYGGDGGDSCNRTSCYKIAIFFRVLLGISIDSLPKHIGIPMGDFQVPGGDGVLRRHPDPERWYSRPGVSRDQVIPYLVCASLFKDKTAIRSFLLAHLRRALLFMSNTFHNHQYAELMEHDRKTPEGGKSWNGNKWKPGDITVFEFWALMIRASRAWYLWPLLLIFDLETLFSTIFKRWSKDHDVIVHTTILLHNLYVYPTPISRLAHWLTDYNDLQRKLDSFFAPYFEPPFGDLYRPILKIASGK